MCDNSCVRANNSLVGSFFKHHRCWILHFKPSYRQDFFPSCSYPIQGLVTVHWNTNWSGYPDAKKEIYSFHMLHVCKCRWGCMQNIQKPSDKTLEKINDPAIFNNWTKMVICRNTNVKKKLWLPARMFDLCVLAAVRFEKKNIKELLALKKYLSHMSYCKSLAGAQVRLRRLCWVNLSLEEIIGFVKYWKLFINMTEFTRSFFFTLRFIGTKTLPPLPFAFDGTQGFFPVFPSFLLQGNIVDSLNSHNLFKVGFHPKPEIDKLNFFQLGELGNGFEYHL